jgi:hypothetical protein
MLRDFLEERNHGWKRRTGEGIRYSRRRDIGIEKKDGKRD